MVNKKGLYILYFLSAFFLLFSSLGCQKKKDEGYYFEKGGEAFQKGNYDEAIELYQKGLEINPKSAVGYNLLGMAYRFKFNQTGNKDWKDKEIEAFKKSIELDPNFVAALVNLGATLYYQGDKKEAARYFKKAIEIYPDHPEKLQLEKMIKEEEEVE